MPDKNESLLTVGLAQIAPVWLRRDATLAKVAKWIARAADQGCQLVVFGEALVPGYPFWVERTDGARFESALQKSLYSHYLSEGVSIEAGHLDALCDIAATRQIAVYVGVMERAADRGGHSLYCSMVYISAQGQIESVHRKLMPTYEERLVWAIGDGHGLRTHALGAFTVGGLNCWENWLPLVRSALYAQGEDLHVAIWPGNVGNTADITRFIAREGRSFVVSVSGLMRKSDMPSDLPHYEVLAAAMDGTMANGGSCLADPAGNWVLSPETDEECLRIAKIDHDLVKQERHNLDVTGHYARPDVTRLVVNRKRQTTVEFSDEA